MTLPPTPAQKLETLYDLARKHLQYVYLGNTSDEKRSASYCPQCGETLIRRSGYRISTENLDQSGRCARCGYPARFVL
jgi:pyruvate formate lyase activating enzyme